MKYEREEIYEVIPNRYPFLFLDTLETDGENAVGTYKLEKDTWFFAFHYPDQPIMPFSLLIEGMTQAFSATFLSQVEKKEIPVISSIRGIDGTLKMKESIVPGDEIVYEAELQSFRRGVAKGICRAFIGERRDVPVSEIEIVEVLPSKMVKMG